MAAKTSGRVCVGAVAGAHGVRGMVRIKSFTERAEDVFAYGPLGDETGDQRFELSPAGHSKGQLLAKVAGVTDRNAAEDLRGTRLYVDRDAMPAPEEDEFYYADLVGLAAEDVAGQPLGQVVAVHDFGAGPVLEIAPESGESIMVPFSQKAAPAVDLADRRLVLDPPAGLLDEAAPESDDHGPDRNRLD